MNAITLLARHLHHGWTVAASGDEVPSDATGPIPVRVPGTSRQALDDAGLPSHAHQGATSWRFSTRFAATPATSGERIDLVFDGLDAAATVILNGVEIGRTANMHRTYRWDVARHLRGGNNELTVEFADAQRSRSLPCDSVGIWRGVRLERWRTARLARVRSHATMAGNDGCLTVHVDVERASAAPLTVFVGIEGMEVSASIPPDETGTTVVAAVPNVEPWWPAGHGPARLYDVAVDLHSEDEQLDLIDQRVGFRTIELDTYASSVDEPFGVRINGKQAFFKGASWMPDDSLLARTTPERLWTMLEYAVDAHLNLLRVWGGGVYETHEFYSACDELGLMVWQDIPFADGSRIRDEAFDAEIVAELGDNVSRLSDHPALVAYGGSADATVFARLESVLADLDPTRPIVRLHSCDDAADSGVTSAASGESWRSSVARPWR